MYRVSVYIDRHGTDHSDANIPYRAISAAWISSFYFNFFSRIRAHLPFFFYSVVAVDVVALFIVRISLPLRRRQDPYANIVHSGWAHVPKEYGTKSNTRIGRRWHTDTQKDFFNLTILCCVFVIHGTEIGSHRRHVCTRTTYICWLLWVLSMAELCRMLRNMTASKLTFEPKSYEVAAVFWAQTYHITVLRSKKKRMSDGDK